MDTIICDIAKTRMVRDFNDALRRLGLFISAIEFDDSTGLSVILKISINEKDSFCA